ncbi:Beta-glucoside kinase [Corynebacterium choanae]|uniref:Beta-glucoside kinase n=2 Tax=Corynebacterium choanae TaxID=1862358 RepID=A0A3G6J6T8_9CORY|nr:Beta-glucoside kinase [Corynebacterium choanae]
MSGDCVIAVDIGGTKIAAAVVPHDQPTTTLFHTTRPSRALEGGQQVLQALKEAIAETREAAIAAGYTPQAIGIGSPGVINPDTGVVQSAGVTMPGWSGTDLRGELRQEFGLAVAAHNDVRVMGLGEAIYGAGKGLQDVLFVAFGTGIGGAIVQDGQLRQSPHSSRGELCYLICEDPTGGVDGMENIGSGTGLAASYRKRAGISDTSVDLREIMRRYHDGEALAKQVLDENLTAVGHCLANFINAIDVEAVVIGGGVAGIGAPIIDPLVAGIRAQLLPPLAELPIALATFGQEAQLIGAAHLGRTAAA